MSVKEMAKGITYDDPIKTRCVSQCRDYVKLEDLRSVFSSGG